MRTLRLFFMCLLMVGCDCGGPTGSPCSSGSDCEPGEVCTDGTCEPREDGGRTDGGDPSDSGQDAGGTCPSMTICGTPPMCCGVAEECVDGACLAACASGVRCGAGLTDCCADGQVCVGSCVDPGDTCTDSFDCPMGSFCEPTLGRCLPQFDPVTCETTPVFGDLEVMVEWSAETATAAPDCMHAISAPVVVDVTGDGVPEVVVNFACDEAWTRGVVRAYSGDGGALVWEATDAALQVNGRTSIAGADLDGDGRSEIVGVRVAGVNRAIAFDDDGTLLWLGVGTDGTTPHTLSFSNGAPTIADLDGDGSPEIIMGAVVYDATGRLLWERDTGGAEGTNNTYAGGIAAVADLDMDGSPEIVTGRRAYEADGTPFWATTTIPDGYPAIAQFDSDPQPEIVLVASGNLYLLDGLDGTVQWGPVAQPGGGRGGPPTVADFDGDGMPEIGVAGAGSYSVYDPTGSMDVLWSSTTVDVSSNATGSSVFDFEGDGIAEVVYGDECYMRVYRGSDGTVLLQIPSVSATIHEYPLVADVDADGNSEIVIVANDRSPTLRAQCTAADSTWSGARRGVFVYGDTRDQWVGTRRIWNQHAYHVTNVRASGVVPALETDNWTTPGLNNYRQNAQGAGVFNAPDLKVLALEVLLDGCPDSVTLRARITNEGNLGAPTGVPVSFYTGTPMMLGTLLGTAPTSVPLLPGATTVVELSGVPLSGTPPFAFVAVVDDDGTGAGIVLECDEDDNAGGIGDIACDIVF